VQFVVNHFLQAFKNKQSLKQEIVSRMKEHINLDQLVQGIGYDHSSGKGCAVGCSINCYDHQSFADTLDIDLWIPQVYDNVHEGINFIHIAKFNLDFLNSIPVGMSKKQSDMVRLKLFYFMLTKIIPSEFQKYKEIAAIINLFKQSIEGVTVTREQWIKVAENIQSKYQFFTSAATSASVSVFASVFASASSASASTSASTSAFAFAFASASASVFASVFASASKQEAMLKIGDKLIELFKEVKVN